MREEEGREGEGWMREGEVWERGGAEDREG